LAELLSYPPAYPFGYLFSEEFAVSTNNLFQALANAADGAFGIDQNQRIIYWNEAAQNMLGYAADEVMGQVCFKILGGHDDRGRLICRHNCQVAAAALNGGLVTNYDTCVQAKSGEVRWVNMSILTFPPGNGEVGPVIVHLFRDATEKVQNHQFACHVLEAMEKLTNNKPLQNFTHTPTGHHTKELTERERQVLSLLAQGYSTANIAQSLSISASTARNHIQNILHKLQVHSRLEALAYAYEHGLVSVN